MKIVSLKHTNRQTVTHRFLLILHHNSYTWFDLSFTANLITGHVLFLMPTSPEPLHNATHTTRTIPLGKSQHSFQMTTCYTSFFGNLPPLFCAFVLFWDMFLEKEAYNFASFIVLHGCKLIFCFYTLGLRNKIKNSIKILSRISSCLSVCPSAFCLLKKSTKVYWFLTFEKITV